MARIAGVDLPRDKRIEIALTYIYGIGLTTSQKLLKLAGVNPDTRTRDLTEDEVVKLRDVRWRSSVSSISAATAAVVIAWDFPCADRTRRTTPARGKVPARPSQARRRTNKREGH